MKTPIRSLITLLCAAIGILTLASSAQAACPQQEGPCFIFEYQGYTTDSNTGQTTLTFHVTNKCRKAVGYVAIGTDSFTRVSPANGSVYQGTLGAYNVAWTGTRGNPGFTSIKFTPQLKNFANSASDTFSIVVSNFNADTTIMVQGKSSTTQETFSFLLSQTCGPQGHIYWANTSAGSIGRADLDGQNANQSFITTVSSSFGVAVDGSHVYWTDLTTKIGRADLDGQNANQNFITGANLPDGVAVDGSHVYWANLGAGTIGRADLDGQNVNQSFITGASEPRGVAVDSSHVYWANRLADTIGRADLDGQNVNQSFITGAIQPDGVAVDGSHVYWATFGSGTIGRADLDGQNVNQSFITGASGPRGVAVDGSHVYWTNAFLGTIGRADLDGQNVNQSFITGATDPNGVAVGP
jgi:sugar lactone lactonase YvrE